MNTFENKQDFSEELKAYRLLVDTCLETVYKDIYPRSLYEPIEYVLSSGGKRLRPVITMLCAGAVGENPEDAVQCGSALEILHNFTLLHDDIMDSSPLRRGRQTVHVKWDDATAILSGDVMLGVAYRLLLSSIKGKERCLDMLDAFTQGLIDVCEGQALDLDFQSLSNISMNQYMQMIEMKTSRLLEISAIVGAFYGNANDETVHTIREFARHLGLAFQIQDDLLDLTADSSEFGKLTGQDLIEGKKSYLIVRASEKNLPLKDKELLDMYIRKKGISMEEIPGMIRMLSDNDVLLDAKNAIKFHGEQAKLHLSTLAESTYQKALMWLTDKMSQRTM
jgi:geranylgeranyl diphosphate synthase, type II